MKSDSGREHGRRRIIYRDRMLRQQKKRLFDQSVNRNQSIVFIMVWLELRKLTVVTHTYRPT